MGSKRDLVDIDIEIRDKDFEKKYYLLIKNGKYMVDPINIEMMNGTQLDLL